jgi:DNA polymerase-3 subunit delta
LASFRPPIFWKDKEIIKHQLKNLTLEKIKFLIVEINHLELNIKKNSFASQQLLNNFILERFRLFSNSI